MSQQRDDAANLSLWDTPVYVRISRGMTEVIDGPHDAMTYLSNRWPAERGQHFEQARLACKDAIEQYGSLEQAREAFIAAANEVHILA
ncbi:hypothetical protein ASE04_22170 [Rhizobium sp. Root708]|uniref:DUF982 domain-containing protein n=1 Tax=Rhizobium sp. Root708 TaxID=1736592 RepID=UPI0006FC3912|nr:DUF982 domain-containing protein [Rhizobium sp. Root708]KRB61560.1 hypothetical protein ASE04_22170 [Rhizobium sp. Root708]